MVSCGTDVRKKLKKKRSFFYQYDHRLRRKSDRQTIAYTDVSNDIRIPDLYYLYQGMGYSIFLRIKYFTFQKNYFFFFLFQVVIYKKKPAIL